MLTIKIKTDNQAFEDGIIEVLSRCLDKTKEKLEAGCTNGCIFDYNGNTCGTFKLTNR